MNSGTMKSIRLRVYRGTRVDPPAPEVPAAASPGVHGADRQGGSSADPHVDYDVSLPAGATVLEALESVRTAQDGSLMYRHSCHHGSCGTCGLQVNGSPRLACLTSIDDIGDGPVVLDPLTGFPHVRDLVVRTDTMFEQFPDDGGYVRKSETNRGAARPAEVREFVRFENCIECGCCVSACPVTTAFMGPAALAAASRELANNPERETEILERVNRDDGVWPCRRSLECSRVCPAGVYPSRHIFQLQKTLSQNGDTGDPGKHRVREIDRVRNTERTTHADRGSDPDTRG